MDQGFSVVIYPVSDLAQAKTLYRTLLEVEPYVDEAYYVGFRVGDLEIGLDPHGHHNGMTGPVGYWPVTDIQHSLQLLLGAGAQQPQADLYAVARKLQPARQSGDATVNDIFP